MRKEKRVNPSFSIAEVQRSTPMKTGYRVSVIRKALSMLDGGMMQKDAALAVGVTRQTLRTWRANPRYREATLEYDPLFPYDPDDMMDRAVVAQHLCTLTPDPSERLALMMASVGVDVSDLDDRSAPGSSKTTGHRQRRKNRKGVS